MFPLERKKKQPSEESMEHSPLHLAMVNLASKKSENISRQELKYMNNLQQSQNPRSGNYFNQNHRKD